MRFIECVVESRADDKWLASSLKTHTYLLHCFFFYKNIEGERSITFFIIFWRFETENVLNIFLNVL